MATTEFEEQPRIITPRNTRRNEIVAILRDHYGRVEAIQVDLVAPALLRALSTTPPRG